VVSCGQVECLSLCLVIGLNFCVSIKPPLFLGQVTAFIQRRRTHVSGFYPWFLVEENSSFLLVFFLVSYGEKLRPFLGLIINFIWRRTFVSGSLHIFHLVKVTFVGLLLVCCCCRHKRDTQRGTCGSTNSKIRQWMESVQNSAIVEVSVFVQH